MEKLQIAVVYGTRPEAIKVAPVIEAIRSRPDMAAWVVSTGQHRELLADVHTALNMHADIDLELYKPGSSLDDIVGRALIELGSLLDTHSPDAVVVHGDTSTTLAAALADFHHHVPVVHLEAGLRTGDLTSPFPEEANRRLVAQISALHLAPTNTAANALYSEGVNPDTVYVIGNTAIDSLLHVTKEPVQMRPEVSALLSRPNPIVTITVHRRENWGDGVHNIGQGVAEAAVANPNATFIAPLHPNPALRQTLGSMWNEVGNIHIVDALPYDQFSHLMAVSSVILSDSGGVQEEAPALSVPLGVLRNTTERGEVIQTGQAVLLGTDQAAISGFVNQVLNDPYLVNLMTGQPSPFGDGHAATRAVQAIAAMFGRGEPPSMYTWHGVDRGEQVQAALRSQHGAERVARPATR